MNSPSICKMKRFLLYLILPIIFCACSSDHGPSMKVVTCNGDVLGRYVSETEDSYIVEVQDTYPVEKAGARVELWKASEGKGIVYLKDFGKANAYSEMNENSEIVFSLSYEECYVPDTYKCLGYRKGWFQIEKDGATGYIQERLVNWDSIDTF